MTLFLDVASAIWRWVCPRARTENVTLIMITVFACGAPISARLLGAALTEGLSENLLKLKGGMWMVSVQEFSGHDRDSPYLEPTRRYRRWFSPFVSTGDATIATAQASSTAGATQSRRLLRARFVFATSRTASTGHRISVD